MVLTTEDKKNLYTTVGLTILFLIIAIISYLGNTLIGLAISVGALGGILHEIVQSDGKILTPKYKENEGVFLGTVYGLIVGAAVGLLAIQGIPEGRAVSRDLMIQIFSAGLALKGISESAAGRAK